MRELIKEAKLALGGKAEEPAPVKWADLSLTGTATVRYDAEKRDVPFQFTVSGNDDEITLVDPTKPAEVWFIPMEDPISSTAGVVALLTQVQSALTTGSFLSDVLLACGFKLKAMK